MSSFAARESTLNRRRRSLIDGPLYSGYSKSETLPQGIAWGYDEGIKSKATSGLAEPKQEPLAKASALLNATKTELSQQISSTTNKIKDVLPASKGELQQEQTIIDELVKQVNALTPVSSSSNRKSCALLCQH